MSKPIPKRDEHLFDDPKGSAPRKTNGCVSSAHLVGVIFNEDWTYFGADAKTRSENEDCWERIRDLKRGHAMSLGRWVSKSETYEQEVVNNVTVKDAYKIGTILAKHNGLDYDGYACCTCA